jgi:hypothetical protein
MQKFYATVMFLTKKGKERTTNIELLAANQHRAEIAAGQQIMNNGQRQAKKILDVRVSTRAPDKIGFFGYIYHKLFNRGRSSESGKRAHA